MDDSTVRVIAAVEAQFLMGHRIVSPSLDYDGVTITEYGWWEDEVRQALFVPLDDTWGERVLELELQGLASFSMYCAPLYWDADGTRQEIPGWQDEPREKRGEVHIYARGVLKLAALYGRPYVRHEESEALWAHWALVWTEYQARIKAHGDPGHEEKWAREYPERALYFQAQMRQMDDELEGGSADV